MIERLTMMTVRSIHGNGNTRNDSPESSHLGVRTQMDLHGSIIEENCIEKPSREEDQLCH